MKKNKYIVEFLLMLILLIGLSTDINAEASTKQKSIAVSKLTLTKRKAELEIFKTLTLNVTVSPANASNKTIKWYSSDKSVATVNSKGVVTAVDEGLVEIIAKSSNGKTATCIIAVTVPNFMDRIKTIKYPSGFYDENVKYTQRLYTDKKLFNWFSRTDIDVYKETINDIFPNGTSDLDDWEIVRNVCYWTLNDYIEGPHESRFKNQYKNAPKDWKDELRLSSGTYDILPVVQHLLGFLNIETYNCNLKYMYPLIAVNVDGDWYYCVLRASFIDGDVSFNQILVSGDYIKEGYDENFIDVFNANHHDYHDGVKVWYINSLASLITDDGKQEFVRRMEESKFTVGKKTYIGIGIGLMKEHTKSINNEFIINYNPYEPVDDEVTTKLFETYPEMACFGYIDDTWTVSAFQLVQSCANKLGYKNLLSVQINNADETNLSNGYAYSTGFFEIKD